MFLVYDRVVVVDDVYLHVLTNQDRVGRFCSAGQGRADPRRPRRTFGVCCWATDLSPISQADRLHEALVRLSASFRFDAPAERRDFRLEESPLSFKWRKWAAKLNLPIPDCEGYSR
jgi:hypothetical protein